MPLFGCLFILASIAAEQQNGGDVYELATINGLVINGIQFPERLGVDVFFGESCHSLNLSRDPMFDDVSIYVLTHNDDGEHKIDLINESESNNGNSLYSHYRDPQNGGVFILYRNTKDNSLSMVGTVYLNGSGYEIKQHHSRSSSENGNTNTVYRLYKTNLKNATRGTKRKNANGSHVQHGNCYSKRMADGVPWFAGNMWSNQGSQWNGGANMWVPPGNGMFGKEELGVELLVFLDDSIYHGMKDEMLAMGQPVPDSVIFNLLKQRYAIIVQGMDLRYGDIAATDYSIKVRLKGVMICTKPQASFWTSARASKQLGKERGVVDVDDALDDFRDYLKQFGHAFPEYDHAMTFTGFDIASEGKTSTIGVAFFEGICSDLSVSIIEDHGNTVTTIETATHELGHSLGSEHDGTGNLCQSDLQYIMAYYVGTRSEQIETNPWKFSDCSITYFRLFKETLKRKNRNCLFDPATTGNLFEWTVFTRQQALQKYTPDIQCKIFQGGMSYHCKGMVPDDKICNKLYCYIVKTGQCKPIQAMEGTPCGFKQWCLRGECKMDTSAPPYM